MITPAYVRTMTAYNSEMNRRTYQAAARLGDAERRADQGAFWGSLHATLCHLLWGDQQWMARFAGWDKPIHSHSAALVENFDTVRSTRVETDARLEAWAQTVDADWLAGDIVWFGGEAKTERRGGRAFLLVHLFNHQTHHRGQAHALLTRLGQDPGVTDLPYVVVPPN